MSDKVLIFDPSARRGGGLSYLLGLAGAIKLTGARDEFVFVCNPAVRRLLEPLEAVADVRYLPETASRGGWLVAAERWRAARYWVTALRPRAMLSMNQLEWRPPVPAALFLRNALYFETADVVRRRLRWRGRLRQRLLRHQTIRSLSKADMVLVPSVAFGRVVSVATGGRVLPTVAHFGLNNQAVSAEPRSYSSGLRWLCSHYNAYKDHESVWEAFQSVAGEVGGCSLLVQDDLLKSQLVSGRELGRAIQESPLGARVQQLGLLPHSDVHRAYAQADIYVHSTVLESFGHGLLEAMGNGLPCIVADNAVNRELGGEAVCYYRSGDAADLVRCARLLMADEGRRREIGIASRIRAQTFSWMRHLEVLRAVLCS